MKLPKIVKRSLAVLALCMTQIGGAQAARDENQFNLNADFENAFGYSMATQAGCLVFIGGIVSIDQKGELVGEGDVAVQAHQLYTQLEAVLKAHDLTLENIVRESFYVKNINNMAGAGEIRAKFYEQAKAAFPSTVGMEISKLGMPGAEIEMTAIAERCNGVQ